jgi:hypothetical protein
MRATLPRSLALRKRLKENGDRARASRALQESPLSILDQALEIYKTSQFIECVQNRAVNERGHKIQISFWFAQYLRFLGDFRIATKVIPGAQQSGKTLGSSLVLAYCAIELGFQMLYTYDSQGARDTQVKRNLQPILSGWESAKFNSKRGDLADNLEIWQSQSGGTVQFLYSSVNAAAQNVKSRQGLASAGGKNVGFRSDGLIDEERSQSPPGARDPFKRRTVRSTLAPYPPHIILGTPGAGLGVEYEMQNIDHHFAPYYDCPHCKAQKPLHPKGCLLIPSEAEINGEKILNWFTESGKPLQWHHHDPQRPESTAFVACSECGGELLDEDRSRAVYRKCRFDISMNIVQDLEQSLDEFLEALPKGRPVDHISVGFWISPLLQEETPAPSIIREGNKSKNTADWQQQNLGITSESGTDGLTLEDVHRAIGATVPNRPHDVMLAGIDQGRKEDWIWISRIWLPSRWREMTIGEVIENAIRGVVLASDIGRLHIVNTLDEYGVDFGMMDGEPDVSEAVDISKESCLELADQIKPPKDDIEKTERVTEGRTYKIYKIRQKDFQDNLVNAFKMRSEKDGLPLYRLPLSMERWIPLVGADRSPITHLTSMQRDPETRKWVRPLDKNDDIFFAGMMMEAALRVWLGINMNKRSDEIAASAATNRDIPALVESISNPVRSRRNEKFKTTQRPRIY